MKALKLQCDIMRRTASQNIFRAYLYNYIYQKGFKCLP